MRINDKIQELELFLSEIISFLPKNIKEYKENPMVRSACERHFEKIVESAVDLAFLIVKEKGLKRPEDDKQVFDILRDNSIISGELCEKLKDAKGMRNIIAHEYGKIDDEIVFNSISEELNKDIHSLVREIKKSL